MKSLSRVLLLATPWQPTRLLRPWDFPGKSTGVGCHNFLQMEHYSAIKNEIMPFAATWMKLGIVILNKISQTEKEKYHITSPICGICSLPCSSVHGYSCLENHGVTKSRTRLSDFTFTFPFHALEKELATHSSVLAWRISGTGEPGGLLSTGSHRVGHD